MQTSMQFGESILKGERRNFRNKCGHGGNSCVMFNQRWGNWGELKYTSEINLYQGDTVTG